MKTSAIDYLIEYVSSDNEDKWLQSVVACYLNSKGSISNVNIERIIDELLSNDNLSCTLSQYNPALNPFSLINIHKLKHVSGVNALAKNQEICFNSQVNVLYGLNGSGKSSYFRILQAMIGNVKSEDIIPNIYLDSVENISVNIDYWVDGKLKSDSWTNNCEINDLKSINVFDSNYSQKFLSKRESDEQVLYPYKLYVFSEISNYIDQIKEAANRILDERKEKNSIPKTEKFLENEKVVFERDLTEQDKEYFRLISTSFDKSKEEELINVQTAINTLIRTNYSDKIQLLEGKIKQYNEVKKRIEDVLFHWIKKSKEYQESFSLYKHNKKESEQKKKQIEVLSKLPGSDSKEWKEFVKAGLLISKNTEGLKNTCPYCHREYNEGVVAIVQAYSIFIQDKTEKDLRESESKLKDIINQAKHTRIEKQDYLFENEEELNQNISTLLNKVIEYIDGFKTVVDFESFHCANPIDFDTSTIISKLDALYNSFLCEKDQLIKESSAREENLVNQKKIEAKLISQKSIHEQINDIIKFIDEEIVIRDLRQRVNAISSNKITRISRIAHDELLTKKLVRKFDDFLEEFQIVGREINLQAKTNKGVQHTELVMKSKMSVTKILSEGEQKAVSIALFLAEVFVAQNNNTIILDDPVNSLDHRMMEHLTNILMQLDNQVIVFTHNRMFLDSISGSDYCHKCKNFQYSGCNNSKGKHVFIYQIKSEGIYSNGVVTSSIKDNAEGYLNDAKELLDKSPFDEELKVCALLRNAIDHIIDEKIFNKQTPRKYSMKGVAQSIAWDELKKMAPDSNMIDDLKRIFGRVSSGQLHIGQASSNNPLDKPELIQLHDELIQMLS